MGVYSRRIGANEEEKKKINNSSVFSQRKQKGLVDIGQPLEVQQTTSSAFNSPIEQPKPQSNINTLPKQEGLFDRAKRWINEKITPSDEEIMLTKRFNDTQKDRATGNNLKVIGADEWRNLNKTKMGDTLATNYGNYVVDDNEYEKLNPVEKLLAMKQSKYLAKLPKTQQQKDEILKPRIPNKFETVVGNAINSATLGINEPAIKKYEQLTGEKTPLTLGTEANPTSSTVGSILGYLTPGTVVERGVGTVIKGTKLLPKLLRGATAGAGLMGAESTLKNKSNEEILKDTITGGAFGVGGELVGMGLGKGFNKLKDMYKSNQLVKGLDNTLNNATQPIQFGDIQTKQNMQPKAEFSTGKYTKLNEFIDFQNANSQPSTGQVLAKNKDGSLKIRELLIDENGNTTKGNILNIKPSETNFPSLKFVEDLSNKDTNYFIQNEAKRLLEEFSNSNVGRLGFKTETSLPIKKMYEGTNLKYEEIAKILEDVSNGTFKNTKNQNKILDVIKDNLTNGTNSLKNKAILPNENFLNSLKRNQNQEVVTINNNVSKINQPMQQINNAPTELPSLEGRVLDRLPTEKFGFNKIKQGFQNIYTKSIDSQYPMAKISNDVKIKGSNARQVSGTVDYILQNKLVDKQGNEVGQGLKEIFSTIPKNKEKEFENFLLLQHNIDRVAQNKPIFSDYTVDMSKQGMENILRSNPEFKGISENINKFLNTFMEEYAVKSGLISKEAFDTMKKMYPNYVPTNRLFDELEKSVFSGAKKGFKDQTNTVKKATGSDRVVQNPLLSIPQLVNRVVRASKYNEVGKSILDTVRANPSQYSDVFELIPSKVNGTNQSIINDGIEGISDIVSNNYSKIVNPKKIGDNIITIMENGNPVQLKVKNKPLLDSISRLDEGNTTVAEQVGRWLMTPFKMLITQANPIFTVKNIARDLPTYIINSVEKNPFKAIGSYKQALSDIVTGSENFKKFQALGGSQSGFFNNDIVKVKDELIKQNLLVGGIKKLAHANAITEMAPRYAEFLNTINKGGSLDQAIYNAAEVTTNFSRSGRYSKAVDSWTPYFNAGIQGLDKFGRNILQRPITTLAKGVAMVTVPTLIVDQFNKNNSNYQVLDNRTKDTNFLLPNIFDRDEKGQPQTFIKIPKTREYGAILGALTERILRRFRNDEEAFKGFRTTLATNFAPANPIENNLLSTITYNIPRNKDFADRDIVPLSMILDNRSPYLQYDERTTEVAKQLGEKLNLSPKQIDYVIKSYSGILGTLFLPSSSGGKDLIDKVLSQFTADPVYNNTNNEKFYEKLKEFRQNATDKNIIDKIPSKSKTNEEKLRNSFNKGADEISKLNKKIKSSQDENQKKMFKKEINTIAEKFNKMYNNK